METKSDFGRIWMSDFQENSLFVEKFLENKFWQLFALFLHFLLFS